jgi:oxygen-dependent protoporphyrinogen oxidase
MTQPMHTVAIVGGGIAGLSAAYALAAAMPSADIVLIEALPKLGGKILTEVINGFVIEAGPDSFISYKPWAIELCHKLGLAHRLMGTNRDQTQTYVLYRGRLIVLPEGLMGLAPTRLAPFLFTPLFSPLGKLRMGLDLIIPKKKDTMDESLAGFVRRRLGREAVDILARPLLAGIYAGDPERMSLQATFPQFAEIEQKHGSLIRGMLARRRDTAGTASSSTSYTMFMTLSGGLGELVETMTRKLSTARIMTGIRVKTLTPRKESGYDLALENGSSLSARTVVLATPAFVTAELLKDLDPGLTEPLNAIPYISTATVTLAYRRTGFGHPLNGFGFVVAGRGPQTMMACTWTSTKFPHRAPSDHVLLRCFVGGAGREEIAEQSEPELIRMVRENLRSAMGITQEPVLARVYRWLKANPQYEVGHLDRVSSIEAGLSRHPGLFLAGAAYRGVGVPDCIRSGTLAAQKVLDYLKTTERR